MPPIEYMSWVAWRATRGGRSRHPKLGTCSTPSITCGPPRRIRRWSAASLLWACLVPALAGLVASPAHAQDTTLVSNVGQTPVSTVDSGYFQQTFTTGDATSGYTLGSVEITTGTDGAPAISVCERDHYGDPISCTSLTAPSSTEAGTLVYTAPAKHLLAANKTYSLYVQGDLTTYSTTTNDGEDSGGAAGWLLGNAIQVQNLFADWVDYTGGPSLLVAIKGSVTTTNNPPVVDNAILDQIAKAGIEFSYGFPENTFSDPDPADSLTYTAALSDDTVLPAWLSFDAATRTFTGTPAAGDVGTVSVKVTATDGADSVSDTFDIVVVMPATDASLIGLTLTAGTDPVELTPAFASDVENYTATVADDVARVAFEAETNDDGATVLFFDGVDSALADADEMAEGHQVDLGFGMNTVKVEVTAEDTMTKKTYTVNVTRKLLEGPIAVLVTNEGGTEHPSAVDSVNAQAFITGPNRYRIEQCGPEGNGGHTVLGPHVREDRGGPRRDAGRCGGGVDDPGCTDAAFYRVRGAVRDGARAG